MRSSTPPMPAADVVAPLEVRHVSVRFDDEAVLDDVSLSVSPGDFIALLGANGSGKTTLVRVMLGLQEPTSGEALVYGIPVDGPVPNWRLALVPQSLPQVGAVPMSVEEVVDAGLAQPVFGRGRHGAPPRLSRHQRADRVRQALADVGLEHRRRDAVDSLSGGQQRRVMVARALVRDADTIVLDEPTAGVDTESQDALAAVFAELSAQGRTLLVVTHELDPLAHLVTRAVVLGDGHILYDGADVPGRFLHDHHPHHIPPSSAATPALPNPLEGPDAGV